MTPALRSLLIASAVFVAGTVSYYVPKATTSNAELVAAGVRDDCDVARVACTFLEDGGYSERTFHVADCVNDAGEHERILPRKLAKLASMGVYDFQGQCKSLGVVSKLNFDNSDPSPRAHSCACRKPGVPHCRHSDAGELSQGEVAQPGDWSGLGCQPTACTEVFGFPSMAKECQP
jgi:hypothetical protein